VSCFDHTARRDIARLQAGARLALKNFLPASDAPHAFRCGVFFDPAKKTGLSVPGLWAEAI
jgi:hypothetical protein